jgi:hypothetical protein
VNLRAKVEEEDKIGFTPPFMKAVVQGYQLSENIILSFEGASISVVPLLCLIPFGWGGHSSGIFTNISDIYL